MVLYLLPTRYEAKDPIMLTILAALALILIANALVLLPLGGPIEFAHDAALTLKHREMSDLGFVALFVAVEAFILAGAISTAITYF